MVELNEAQSREVRNHPLFAAAVHIQRDRILHSEGERPVFRGPNPDQVIEQLVGWSAVYDLEDLVKSEGKAMREHARAGCLTCQGTGNIMVEYPSKKVPKTCSECYLPENDVWAEILRTHPDLAQQYSFELQCWGVVAAMVADEAMVLEKATKDKPERWGIVKTKHVRRRRF